uniref:Aquaporin n=1 Tax=Meloidogyne javanica TaxID=6303 RepID=A0A915MMF3_MELJA
MSSFPAGMSPVESLRHSSFRIRDRLLVNLLSEFLGTFLLVLIGCSSIAQFILSEAKLNNHLQNLGTPINPARDFGPRLFMLFGGYGLEAFSWRNYYFWIPIIAPLIGALLGTWIYQFLVGINIPDEKVEGKAKRDEIVNNDHDALNLLTPI